MSIALDIALYLRDNKVKGLILPARAVLYTLAFRIGSNSSSWISQKALCHELDIKPRCLKKHIGILKDLGLILIKPSKNDCRKNIYKIAEFLINYHLRRGDQKKSIPNCAPNSSSEKYVHDHAPNFNNRGTIVHLLSEDRCTNAHLSEEENVLEVIDTTEEINENNSPKATYINKATYKSKTTIHRKERDFDAHKDFSKKESKKIEQEILTLPTQLSEESWSDFMQHRKSIKAPMSLVAQRRALKVLDKFQKEGHDINEIVNTSIVNGWKGLFAPSQTNGSNFKQGNGNESTKHDGRYRNQGNGKQRSELEIIADYFASYGIDYYSTPEQDLQPLLDAAIQRREAAQLSS